MHRYQTISLCAALTLAIASSAARADGTAPAPAAAPPPAQSSAPSSGPGSAANSFDAGKFIWGGLGVYGLSESESVTECVMGFCETGSGSFSTTAFALNAGGAYGFAQLAPGFKLDGWADLSLVFASGDLTIPINAGVGVTYDKLPVDLFGGLALELAIPTASGASTSVGVDLKLMGIYPLPQVVPHFGVQAQFNLAFLSQSLTIWALTFGVAYSF